MLRYRIIKDHAKGRKKGEGREEASEEQGNPFYGRKIGVTLRQLLPLRISQRVNDFLYSESNTCSIIAETCLEVTKLQKWLSGQGINKKRKIDRKLRIAEKQACARVVQYNCEWIKKKSKYIDEKRRRKKLNRNCISCLTFAAILFVKIKAP